MSGPIAGESLLPFLKALGDSDPAVLQRWLAGQRLTADIARWADTQNVGPYLYGRLQSAGALDGLPQESLSVLQAARYQAVAANTIQRRELAEVLGAWRTAGIEVVLLKGTALAYTVYADPISRLKGDIDAWIQVDQLAGAVAALGKLGYRPRNKSDRPPELVSLVGGELQMLNRIPGTGLIELQWPAFRGEWTRYTTRVDHAAIRSRCRPIAIEGQRALVMAPEDTLIHLCHHQAISHQFGFPGVRGLFDLHLIARGADPDWHDVVSRARNWRLATVVWTVCDLSRRLLDSPIPEEVLNALAPAPWRRQAIRRLGLDRMLLEMAPVGFHRRRLWIQLVMIDRVRDAARLMGRALFPEKAWLRARYGTNTSAELWRARLLHPWRLLTAARV